MGVSHAFFAITPVTAMAMLSKRWDDCNPPIIRIDHLQGPVSGNVSLKKAAAKKKAKSKKK